MSYTTVVVQLYKVRKSPHFKVLVSVETVYPTHFSRDQSIAPFYSRQSAQEYAQEQAEKYHLESYTDFTDFWSDL